MNTLTCDRCAGMYVASNESAITCRGCGGTLRPASDDEVRRFLHQLKPEPASLPLRVEAKPQ